MPRLEVDYHREVGEGELDIDVDVLSIGRTSFRVCLHARQNGELAARAEVVLVVFDYRTRRPTELSADQRAALESVATLGQRVILPGPS